MSLVSEKRPALIEWPLRAPVAGSSFPERFVARLVETTSFDMIDPDEGGISGFVFGLAVGAIGLIVLIGSFHLVRQMVSIVLSPT